AVFRNKLFFGTMNFVDGCEVYCSGDGTKWRCLAGWDSEEMWSGFCRLFKKNIYVWSMREFNDELYVGTCTLPKRFALSFLLEHQCLSTDGTFTVRKPRFLRRGFEIWKWKPSEGDDGKWIRVVGGLGVFTEKPAGLGDRDNWGARTMEVFKGRSGEEHLYVGTAVNGFAFEKGGEVWRRNSDGKWEKVFGRENYRDPYYKYIWCMKKLDYENRLFVGLAHPSWQLKRAGQVWSTEDGKRWVKEETSDLEGYWDSRPRGMVVFNDELYLGIYNFTVGCSVLRRKRSDRKR
ncbi:MAG: hypothetical protein ACXQS2_03700, partial [Methermicoccaceae archaeon]